MLLELPCLLVNAPTPTYNLKLVVIHLKTFFIILYKSSPITEWQH